MATVKDEVERRFLRTRVDDTRCPEAIRQAGITDEHVYLLRERVDCGDWQHVEAYFVRPEAGRYIVADPPAARRYLTVRPEQVVHALKKQGVW